MSAEIVSFPGEYIDPQERQVQRIVDLLESAFANPQSEQQQRFKDLIERKIATAE